MMTFLPIYLLPPYLHMYPINFRYRRLGKLTNLPMYIVKKNYIPPKMEIPPEMAIMKTSAAFPHGMDASGLLYNPSCPRHSQRIRICFVFAVVPM